jgi:hypothetical protein
MKMGRFDEAEDHLLAAYSGLNGIFGASHSRTVTAVKRLVELYENWNKPLKAKEYRALLAKDDLEK